ncbi:MAG: RbsD/FucU domain-containing protein [Spirochaetales bacterium]
MRYFSFYERLKRAYAIVARSETPLYANIILKVHGGEEVHE